MKKIMLAILVVFLFVGCNSSSNDKGDSGSSSKIDGGKTDDGGTDSNVTDDSGSKDGGGIDSNVTDGGGTNDGNKTDGGTSGKEIINGHTLPPEPDPTVNNSTLLGIDSNNNGVRDDVERKIYKKFPKKLFQVMLMDNAKFLQLVLARDVSEAKETVKVSIQTGNCELYLIGFNNELRNDFKEGDVIIENYRYVKGISINTPKRVRKNLDYNIALSGGVYGGPISDWNRDACSKEVVEALEEMGL